MSRSHQTTTEGAAGIGAARDVVPKVVYEFEVGVAFADRLGHERRSEVQKAVEAERH